MNDGEYISVAADFSLAEKTETAKRLVGMLGKAGMTIATAESCTGGLMGKLITDVPGASAVFVGGAITYTNEAKIKMLGVSGETIEKYTEVSFAAAEEMARGATNVLQADIGISTTGFAGPGGGNDKDPVGTVYVGVCMKDACTVYRLSFDENSTRESVRLGTAHFAFDAVLRLLSQASDAAIVENR